MTATQKPTIAAPEAGAVQVEQCDRDAVARLSASLHNPLWSMELEAAYRAGKRDDSDYVQAFAAHRLAAQAQPTPSRGESGAREAVARIVDPDAFKTKADYVEALITSMPASMKVPDISGAAQRLAEDNYAAQDWRRKAALAKADAILALPELSTPIPTGEALREALRDIAEAEAIPNDAVAFIFCREIARNALAMGDRS